MSTRCQYGIFSEDFCYQDPERASEASVLLYRHSDGMPDRAVTQILPFLRQFILAGQKGRRDWGAEYLGARLLQFMCNQYDEQMRIIHKRTPSSGFTLGEALVIGYGIEQELHGDEQFFYAIRPYLKGCVVEAWDIPLDWSGDFKDAKLVKKTLVDVAEQEKAK